MARSEYIYIALVGELPICACTVKFELYQWVVKQSIELQNRMVLMRVKDGDPTGSTATFIQAKALIDTYAAKPKPVDDIAG